MLIIINPWVKTVYECMKTHGLPPNLVITACQQAQALKQMEGQYLTLRFTTTGVACKTGGSEGWTKDKGNVTESSLCACDMSWAGSRGTKGGVVGFKGLCWTVSWMDNSSGSEQVDPCDHKSKRTSLALEMANLVDISKISVSRPSSNMYKL